jgi:hypothetical protein
MNIDLKKYKRIFAFGCSFTFYKWQTWADLIAVETKAEYYNYAIAGLGNMGIMARVAEANAKYKFNDTDLVMIMWSTFSREDRWINTGWFTQGNVWNSEYPKSWVKDYCDPAGYMIRDHAIINLVNKSLAQSNCGTILLKSIPFKYTEYGSVDNEHVTNTLSSLYQKEYDDMPISLYDFLGQNWSTDPVPYITFAGHMQRDPHSKPTLYYDYLKACGLELSKTTHEYALEATHLLTQCKTEQDIQQKFGTPLQCLISKDFTFLL